MQPTPKGLILDLLSTLKRGSMPVGALVEAGDLFGLAGNAMRVALARLLASGEIARDERGRYRLGGEAQAIRQRTGSWRDSERRVRRWEGGWLAVHPVAPGRSEQRGRERALRLLGFRPLLPSLWLRPDNLDTSLDDLRSELGALGLPAGDLVFELAGLDASTEERARKLWDAPALCASHRKLRRKLEQSSTQLERLAHADAMVESFLLGGQAIRQLVLDPLLPDAICPPAERQALALALRDYDRQGRAAWAGFLKRFDVPYLRTPLDTRLARTASELAAQP